MYTSRRCWSLFIWIKKELVSSSIGSSEEIIFSRNNFNGVFSIILFIVRVLVTENIFNFYWFMNFCKEIRNTNFEFTLLYIFGLLCCGAQATKLTNKKLKIIGCLRHFILVEYSVGHWNYFPSKAPKIKAIRPPLEIWSWELFYVLLDLHLLPSYVYALFSLLCSANWWSRLNCC